LGLDGLLGLVGSFGPKGVWTLEEMYELGFLP